MVGSLQLVVDTVSTHGAEQMVDLGRIGATAQDDHLNLGSLMYGMQSRIDWMLSILALMSLARTGRGRLGSRIIFIWNSGNCETPKIYFFTFLHFLVLHEG
jgi:hypothetical protein